MARRLAAVALILVLGGCGGGGYTTGVNPPPPPPSPPPAPNTITIAGTSFNPATLTVSAGTTVTWNFQTGPHNVTFEDGVDNSDNQSSGTHTRQFGTAGTYRFRCTIHSDNFTTGMVGSITVQ